MSEDSFVTVYNERSGYQTVSELYDTCNKLQKDVTSLRKENIELEGQLVQQKNQISMIEGKYQRALQDIEHYKIKSLIEKRVVNSESDECMDLEYDNIYILNEENLKKNLVTEMKNCDLEHQCKELEQTIFDLEHDTEVLKINFTNLQNAYDDLKSFVENKKVELLEMNQLRLKISELENSIIGNEQYNSNIYLGFAKIDELQVKCFKLENENKKYKENHTNLLLLVEENTSLSNQIDRLEKRLSNYDSQSITNITNINSDTNSEHNMDKCTVRKLRHIERENEILKSEQTQLVETNSNLLTKLHLAEEKLVQLKNNDETLREIIEEKNKVEEIHNNQLHCLTRDCDSYQKVLSQFAQQSTNNMNENVSELLRNVEYLYQSLETNKSKLDQQLIVLDQLTQVAMSRLDHEDNYNNNSDTQLDRSMKFDKLSLDQQMIIELRQQIEYLYNELDKKSIDQINSSNNKSNDLIDNSIIHDDKPIQLQSYDYIDMGFSKSIATTMHDNNRKIFRQLSNELLQAVRLIIGYNIELGPNGYVTVHSCFANDPSQLLEFKMDNNDNFVLLDNDYSLSIKQQINYNESYPILLANITVGLVEKIGNFMS